MQQPGAPDVVVRGIIREAIRPEKGTTAMLDNLISKFKNANGRSEFVIAAVCDIRGFSRFSSQHEAPDVAMFCKRFYVRLLEQYFADTDFAKATGDGLLLLFRYSEDNLYEVADAVLRGCLDVVRDFPAMMKDDPMINYTVPDAVGFGIARGTAFCLHADGEPVDYSGQTLNTASRLNEFARPHGVVIDSGFMLSVIPEDLRAQFHTDTVYIRGIAEEFPREVFCSSDVVIPPEAKASWRKSVLRSVDHVITAGFVKKMPENVSVRLPEEPSSSIPCSAKVQWVHSTAGWLHPNAPEYTQWRQLTHTHVEHTADGFFAHIRSEEIAEIVAEERLSSRDQLTIRIQYVPAPSGKPPFILSGG